MEHSTLVAHIPNASGEVKVTVTIVLNASFGWLEKPMKSFISSNVVACIALGLLAFAAFALNFCLLLAVLCSSSLKKVILNQFVSSVSLACLLESSVNVPFSLYYMRNGIWLLGTKLCILNAACVLVISLFVSWSVCGMCIERWLSLFKPSQSKHCRMFCKQVVVMVTMATACCAAVFPLLLGLIEARAFPARFSCSIATNGEVYYRFIITACFALPICVSVILLLCAFFKNIKSIRIINTQRVEMSYAELFFEESHLWNEWQISKFVGFIVMLFLVLELPSIVNQIQSVTVPYSVYSLNDLEQNNSTIRVFFPVTQITPSVERTFSWCRYSFNLFFPFTTLMLRKDIRRKLNVLLSLFNTSSSVPNTTVLGSPSPDENPDDFLVPQVWRRRRRSSITSLTAPIVFGSSKTSNTQLQLLDITSGIAKWKANLEQMRPKPMTESKRNIFFYEAFEEDDEQTEFSSYQDLTEEEINLSEHCETSNNFREVAVQTTEKGVQIIEPLQTVETLLEIDHPKPEEDISFKLHTRRHKIDRNRKISKSFTYSRVNNNTLKQRYYMTYPKVPPKQKAVNDNKTKSLSSDLLRALQAKRSKTSFNACDILPRGTEELLDCTVESRDVVSL